MNRNETRDALDSIARALHTKNISNPTAMPYDSKLFVNSHLEVIENLSSGSWDSKIADNYIKSLEARTFIG